MSSNPLGLQSTARYIAGLQLPSGALPWFEGGIVDPWDHVEAIMGLTVGGYAKQARHGFDWLMHTQRADGAWYAAYIDETIADSSRAESNFVAYPATGLWHYYQATSDLDALKLYWPMIRRAMQFVLTLQTADGEIYWAVDARKGISRDALITGCSSIYKSLQCTAAIASALEQDPTPYLSARHRLGDAIRSKPHLFDRTWESKARYSMDWFYPVLTGVVQGDHAVDRLQARWHEFVETDLGCRCVVEEPWVTVAETCELVMACTGAGQQDLAQELYSNLQRFQVEDGSWWTGYVFKDDLHWPDERPSWTAAAILLAADALYELTPAHHIFKIHD
jgi:hypothetical protein